MARCEICGEGSEAHDGVPDLGCWDGSASEADIHRWMSRVLGSESSGDERRLLDSVCDRRAAAALRSYLGIEGDPRLLALVIRSLARCGDAGDEPLVRPFLSHPDRDVRIAARMAITEFDLPDAGDLVAAGLDEVELDARGRPNAAELDALIDCLVWLEDDRALPPLRTRLEIRGLESGLVDLARMGTHADRLRIAELAIADLERAASPDDARWAGARRSGWVRFVEAVTPVAPELVEQTKERLSDRARELADADPLLRPEYLAWLASSQSAPRIVPRRSIVGYTSAPTESATAAPPAKFCGQPDWREAPSWPVGSDGRLLMFYGQLPLDDGRTAYLFTAGPDEWELGGGGSALVIQPGGRTTVETRPVAIGPQIYDWSVERPRYLRHLRRVPAAAKFPVFADGADPETYDHAERAEPADWDKIGGTPLWLQGDELPGEGWSFAFQFSAGLAGGERGDGAVFYGVTHEDGRGALGWQCS